MDSFLRLLCSLLIGVVASTAALLPAQVYWNTVLPNTRMPTAFSDLLNSGEDDVGASNWKHGIIPSHKLGNYHFGSHKLGNYHFASHKLGNYHFASHKLGNYHFASHKLGNYHFGDTKEQMPDNLQVKIYFLEQDIYPGSKLNVTFEKINDPARFLPRSEAESIPFSSNKLPEIISRFSVQPGSMEEKAMEETLWGCERPALMGEKQICATSLESIVDFAVASLDTTDVKSISTTVHSENESPEQEYTIVPSGVKNLAQDDLVACHQETYPCAVFFCHLTKSTKSYTVKLTGKDGTVVDTVAVCHTDTSAWNPEHLAFQELNVKPGTVPVCHFMPQNHVVFSRQCSTWSHLHEYTSIVTTFA